MSLKYPLEMDDANAAVAALRKDEMTVVPGFFDFGSLLPVWKKA
jgi:hypothetical protein